jgi:hypothetical protein
MEDLGLTPEQASDVFHSSIKMKSLEEPMKEFFEKFEVQEGVNIPRSILHTLGPKGLKMIGGDVWGREGMQPDIPMIISKKIWQDPEKQKGMLELFDNEEMRKTLKQSIDEVLRESDFATFLMEGKTILSYSKRLAEEQRGRPPERTLYSGIGGTAGQGAITATGVEYVPAAKEYSVETIKNATTEQFMNMTVELKETIRTVFQGLLARGGIDEADAYIMALVKSLKGVTRERT